MNFITSDACHNYGSVAGCDEGCPVLLDGECTVFDEVKHILPHDVYEELKDLYE